MGGINYIFGLLKITFFVTIAAHKQSDEIEPGTLNSIFKQAQIDRK